MANEGKNPMQATCCWSQREDHLLITVQVEGCAKPDIKITKDKLSFNGVGKIGKVDQSYQMEFDFLHPVIPAETKKTEPLSTRFIVLKVIKEEKKYWTKLSKEKVNWIKVDFNNWRDEDESDEEDNKTQDLEKMMSQMGGFGGGGDFGGMDFGSGAAPDSDDEADSDDEKMPDLE